MWLVAHREDGEAKLWVVRPSLRVWATVSGRTDSINGGVVSPTGGWGTEERAEDCGS